MNAYYARTSMTQPVVVGENGPEMLFVFIPPFVSADFGSAPTVLGLELPRSITPISGSRRLECGSTWALLSALYPERLFLLIDLVKKGRLTGQTTARLVRDSPALVKDDEPLTRKLYDARGHYRGNLPDAPGGEAFPGLGGWGTFNDKMHTGQIGCPPMADTGFWCWRRNDNSATVEPC